MHRREIILLGALPTASMTAMFAVEYNIYTEESDATILLSTVVFIGTVVQRCLAGLSVAGCGH